MTMTDSNRCVQSLLLTQWGSSDESGSVALADGCVSMDASSLAAFANELFAVGLDLAATRSVAPSDTADRLDRAIEEIDAIISAIRLAALPTHAVIEQRCDAHEQATLDWESMIRR